MERGLKVGGMIGRMLESRKAYRAFQIWKEVVYDIQEGERGLERRIECASRLVRKKAGVAVRVAFQKLQHTSLVQVKEWQDKNEEDIMR